MTRRSTPNGRGCEALPRQATHASPLQTLRRTRKPKGCGCEALPRLNATRILLSVALALATAAWAKDELIPTQPKSRRRHEKQNPLTDVADDMHGVARRLKEAKTGEVTQKKQEEILEKLKALIDKAEKQQQQQSKGGQGEKKQRQQKQKQQPKQTQQQKQKQVKKQTQKQKQQQKRTTRPGIGRPGSGTPSGAFETDAGEWGDLPPAIREQLLQTQGEGFPLKYRELLRRYYRELSRPRD